MRISTHEKMQKKKVKDMLMRLVCLLLAIVMIVSLNSSAMAHDSVPSDIGESHTNGLSDVTLEFCDNWDDDFDFDSLFESLELIESPELTETAMIYYFGWDGTTVREVPLDYLDGALISDSNYHGITALEADEDDLDIVVLYYFGDEEPVVRGVLAERLDEAILEHMNWDGTSPFEPSSEPYEIAIMYYFDWDSDEPQVMNIDGFYELVYPSLYMEAGNNYNLDSTGITPFNVATLNLSASSWTSSFNASSTTIQVTSNRQWTINNGNLGWVRVENITPANRTGNGSFRLTTSPNPGTQSRSGTITVTAPGAPTRTISVTQQGHPPSLTLSTSSWSPTSAASSAVVTVNANGTWSISSNQSWLTITNITPSTRTGGGFFTMNAPANPNSSTRSATVSVTVPGVPTRTITVTQAAHQANLAVSSSGWHLQTHHSSQATVNVTSNGNWTVSSNATSWLTVSRSSGSGNASFVMSASANTGSTARNGTITVSIPGVVTRTIPVSQAAEAGSLSLSLSTWTPSNFADSINVNVFSNRAWNVSSNATSWLTVSPASGSNNGSFTINATANTGANSRTGTITVTATGAPTRTISVSQAGVQIQNFTLTFMLNGGSGIPTTMTVPSGTLVGTALMPLPTPQRTGYTFMGWFDFQQIGMSSFDEDMLDMDLYGVDFDLNIYEYESGSFGGYVTNEAYSIEPFSVAIGSFVVTGNRTLHAHWFRRFEVTFVGNGGTVTEQRRYVVPGAAIGHLPTATRTNFTFHGWSTAPDRNEMVDYTMRVNRDMRLYARWAVTITFNPMGGYLSQANSTRTVVPGSLMQGGAFPTPTRQGTSLGRRFVGWYDAIVGGNRVHATSLSPSSNTTLFARWESNIDQTRHLDFWYWSNTIFIPLEVAPSLDLAFWRPAMDRGRLSWNRSDAPVHFYIDHSSSYIVRAEPRWDSDHLGWLQFGGNQTGNQLTKIEIYLNSRSIVEHYYDDGASDFITLDGLIERVMAHELGHVVGLSDNPPTIFSLMFIPSYAIGILGPTDYDIESVKMIYD
ncbi:MAG: InlB B-repeat-containing protein [Defluviitaleaceae bacterium]|nr:InlB B-repeat-containing protein [Defluviitaleaceae bacterium]